MGSCCHQASCFHPCRGTCKRSGPACRWEMERVGACGRRFKNRLIYSIVCRDSMGPWMVCLSPIPPVLLGFSYVSVGRSTASSEFVWARARPNSLANFKSVWVHSGPNSVPGSASMWALLDANLRITFARFNTRKNGRIFARNYFRLIWGGIARSTFFLYVRRSAISTPGSAVATCTQPFLTILRQPL